VNANVFSALVAALLSLPTLAQSAALAPDALALFDKPGVPEALHAKVEHGVPLTLPDVITLAHAEVSRGAIIDYLYSFGRHFRLTTADILELRRQGVSPDLIDYMTSPASHPGWFGY
jgi:hypothetical protein